jgi:heat shock gene repressor HrcA
MARRANTSPSTDLDPRKATILEAVVAEHIDTAQPVGSSSVASNADLGVSPATVRSEMVSLEREGYLAQPHTSAGRVPTDKGYRYFVDHLQSGVLGATQQHQLADFFANVRGEVEDVLEQTSTLLSQMTNYTAVVLGATHAHATILSAQLVSLDAHHQLLVAVFSDGSVIKHSLTPSFDVDFETCAEASRQLNALLIGTTLESQVQVPSRNDHVAQLVRDAVQHGVAVLAPDVASSDWDCTLEDPSAAKTRSRHPAPEGAAAGAVLAPAAPDASATPAGQGGVPIWAWWVGAVLLAALVLWLR